MEAVVDIPEAILLADKLPSLPTVAMEILRVSKDPNVEVEEVAATISQDPALAMKVMRFANTPRYRRGSEISSLTVATNVLGMRTLNLLALSFSLTSSLPKSGEIAGFDFQHYWIRSVTTAIVARDLDRFVRTPFREEAFLCGLLARLGQLVMATTISDAYASVCEQSMSSLPSAKEEKSALGYDFHKVGEGLMRSWGMPDLICDTIGRWGNPDEFGDISDRKGVVSRFVYVADAISDLMCNKADANRLDIVHNRIMDQIGISSDEGEEFIVSLEEQVAAMAEILDLKPGTSMDYVALLQEARDQTLHISLESMHDLQETRSLTERLESRNRELDLAAKTDKLTQLPNRSYFDERLAEVINARLAGDAESNLGVLMMDVDHFKKFNDTYGHLAGDAVLQAVGRRLLGGMRDTDFVARYGGEEFVAILPNTNLVDIEAVAERMRKSIESEVVSIDGHDLQVTMSFGGACLSNVTSRGDGKVLLEMADKCLYEAKQAGRNQWVCREI